VLCLVRASFLQSRARKTCFLRRRGNPKEVPTSVRSSLGSRCLLRREGTRRRCFPPTDLLWRSVGKQVGIGAEIIKTYFLFLTFHTLEANYKFIYFFYWIIIFPLSFARPYFRAKFEVGGRQK
jgi:hypothetical protein